MIEPATKPQFPASGELHLVIASRLETEAIEAALHHEGLQFGAGQRIHLCTVGVGKVAAAIGTILHLQNARPGPAVNLGIAGALPSPALANPGASPAPLGSVVLTEFSTYADEGVQTPTGFTDLWAMGFPPGPFDRQGVPADPLLRAHLRQLLPEALPGTVATVSTCSGTDGLAAAVANRTGAIAECMEGAAVAQACLALARPFAEVRVISNTTGNRDAQVWAMRDALAKLGHTAVAIASPWAC